MTPEAQSRIASQIVRVPRSRRPLIAVIDDGDPRVVMRGELAEHFAANDLREPARALRRHRATAGVIVWVVAENGAQLIELVRGQVRELWPEPTRKM